LLANVKDGENIGVIESAQDTSFVLKTEKPVRVAGNRGREDFDGDRSLKPRVTSAIYLAHTAGTQRRQNFVRAEFRA
jgi:hypothetical protein